MSIITDKPGLLSGIALADLSSPRTRAGEIERIIERDREENTKTLHDEQAHTHNELEAAAKDLHAADLAMRTAQERYRKALAAHMAAITGAKVEP